MKQFNRPEHRIIGEALGRMDGQFLAAAQCWFGGGTAIVLKLGEYRVSRDIDFLCADADGYRMLRSAAVENGVRAFFGPTVEAVRDFRIDQYGIRTAVRLKGQIIKFEVVRESRICLDGNVADELGVPTLSLADLSSEKLLANADRCQDRSVAFRDAIDLGMLIRHQGELPIDSVEKAEAAYGDDVARKVAWVTNTLRDADEMHGAAGVLRMAPADVASAISNLRCEATRIWPDAGIKPDAAETNQ